MDQFAASTAYRYDDRPMTVSAPHEWDGIGQALRSAYRDHRETPREIADVLDDLSHVM